MGAEATEVLAEEFKHDGEFFSSCLLLEACVFNFVVLKFSFFEFGIEGFFE